MGNRAGALGKTSFTNINQDGSSKTQQVDTPVLVKAFVLYGNKGFLELLRDLLDGDDYPVLGSMKLGYFAFFAVENIRCLHRLQGCRIQLRRGSGIANKYAGNTEAGGHNQD